MKNMKKAVIGSLAAGIILTIGATNVVAAGRSLGAAKNFVDTDENGICDYANNICNYIERNCGELTKRFESVNALQCEKGQNYVDADNDGICDNYGTGKGRRHCGGRNK